MLRIAMLVFVLCLGSLSGIIVQAQTIASTCQEAAATKPPDEILIEYSKGEEMISAHLSDLDHSNPVFRCAVARWSDPTAGNPTIIVVVNSDAQLILGQTIVTIETADGGNIITSLPQDVGPGSVGVFLFAGEVGAIQLATTVNGQQYISVSRTFPRDKCGLKKMSYAMKRLKALTTTDADKFDVLSRHKTPAVRTIGIFFEDRNLGLSGEFIMEWAPGRTDGIGCVQ